ncbi:hypothetical protein HDU67_001748 [Dinochytrium kinnereticum]|nr:hypothetical protein HDU67_001748 [Dinochytrium kinnereticum]
MGSIYREQKFTDASKSELSLDDSDLASFYEVLKSPVETNVDRGSTPSRLDPEYIKSLQFRLSPNQGSGEFTSSNLTAAVQKDDFALNPDVSVDVIIKVIHLYSQLKSPERALAIFNQAVELGQDISISIVNALMDAYAEVGNLDRASEVFKDIRQRKLKPDIISYGTLIKAAVNADDLRAAFQIYETMKEKNVHPNLPIFTTLIKGCVHARDVSRAWKTFDYMRGEICEPDTTAYSLMIHACAVTQDCERALDLFEEMATKGVPATEVTYNSLIQACGSRPDYYLEAWDLFDQMRAQGFSPTKRTFNVLLWIAARNGDLKRSEMIWESLRQQSLIDARFKPDVFSHMAMFHALSKAAAQWCRTPSKTRKILAKEESAKTSGGRDIPLLPAKSTPDVEETGPKAFPNTYGVSSDALEKEEALENQVASSPESESEDFVMEGKQVINQSISTLPLSESPTARSIMNSAKRLWNNSLRLTTEGDKSIDPKMKSEILDHYLSVYCSLSKNSVATTRALSVFKSFYDKHGISKTGKTYSLMLSLVSKDKDIMKVQGRAIWEEFLNWDKVQEENLKSEKGFLTKDELEIERQKQHRGKNVIVQNFIRMAKGLTRLNDVDGAMDVLDDSARFREPFYLPPIHFQHVRILVDKVRDLAIEGHLAPAERLRIICDPPSDNAVEEVKRVLKKQWVASDWWGWEALGVQEDKRRKILRDRKRERERVKQYFDNKKRK